MGNISSSSSKLAEKCPMLEKSELPLIASSFRIASKNSDKCKEEELMVCMALGNPKHRFYVDSFSNFFRNSGDHKWIHGWHSILPIFSLVRSVNEQHLLIFLVSLNCMSTLSAVRWKNESMYCCAVWANRQIRNPPK